MATITVAGKTTEVQPGTTIENAVRSLGYVPDAFIFVIGGKPVPMDTPIEDTAEIRAIKVASGG